jgi:PAS domain S-box-containing protein
VLAADAGVDAETIESVRAQLVAGQAVRLELLLASGPPSPHQLELCVQPVPGRFGGDWDFVAVVTDVTAREHSLRALAESEDRYRRLVEASPAPIVVHRGGRIRFVNPAGLDLVGAVSAEEVLNRPIMDFVHPDFREIVTERVLKMEETGEGMYLLEEKLLRLDGEVIDVEIAGAQIVYEGEPAIQLVGRDVTDRRRAEEENRRLQERILEVRHHESLVGVADGVAHQLAGLSSTIVDTADQTLMEVSADPAGSALLAIRKAGLEIATLTEQLRAYAGRRRIVRRRVDLSQLVVDISGRLEAEIGGLATVSYELPGDLPRVSVDASLLRRVAQDLVRNAADALGGKPGAIRVRTHVVEADAETLARVEPPAALEPGRYVALEVRDTGCGMDANTRSRILDPFFSTKSPGRGLGLCEVCGLVRAQGGGIQVESEPGRGTTVTVLLPAVARLASVGSRPQAGVRSSS